MTSESEVVPHFPDEIFILILEKCDPFTLMNCYQVNHKFQDICKRYVKSSFTQVICRYWERNVIRSYKIVQKYFPNHTTPNWALKIFLREEKEDLFCITHRKGQLPDMNRRRTWGWRNY